VFLDEPYNDDDRIVAENAIRSADWHLVHEHVIALLSCDEICLNCCADSLVELIKFAARRGSSRPPRNLS
jgi:hypothetical protein